jgi:hypothetical protein
MTDPQGSVWRYAWLPLTAALLGVLLGVHPLWWPQAQRMLLFIGQARLAAVEPALPGAVDRSEYLVVLREHEQRDDARQYFAEQPDIDYIGESIYPKTLVVALRIPVGTSKQQLAAQPFTRTILPVLPLFFCH